MGVCTWFVPWFVHYFSAACTYLWACSRPGQQWLAATSAGSLILRTAKASLEYQYCWLLLLLLRFVANWYIVSISVSTSNERELRSILKFSKYFLESKKRYSSYNFKISLNQTPIFQSRQHWVQWFMMKIPIILWILIVLTQHMVLTRKIQVHYHRFIIPIPT